MGNKGGKDGSKDGLSVPSKGGGHRPVKSLGTKAMERNLKKDGAKKVTMDSFQNVKIIGKGAYGEVRLCRKIDDQKLYAVKVMIKRNLKSSQVPRLLAERDLMAFADHEYIVKLHYSFQDEEKLYLVMDFMQGGDLMGLLIDKDIFDVKATRFYIGELCLAVHSVHILGYCHRDLKPDNVLIAPNGHVKLADFGLAKQLKKVEKKKIVDDGEQRKKSTDDSESTKVDEKTKMAQWQDQKKQLAHSMVGTPDYMAPEIFTHDGYDEECDWWGVGCIMFECLAGYAPFYQGGDCDIQDTVHNVKNWQRKLNLDKVRRTDKNAADLISKLICHYSTRLNFNGIKEHPFFDGFNWDDTSKNAVPYHKPEDLQDELDTRYFIYDPDESESEDEEDGVKKPVGKVQDFTFYVSEEDKNAGDAHHVTSLWTEPDGGDENV